MIKQPGDVLSRLALQTFRWPLGHWYWGDAICVDGLLAASPTIPAARLRAMELVRGWLDRVPPGYHDALAPGAADPGRNALTKSRSGRRLLPH